MRKDTVQSVDRTFDILELLALNGEDIGLSQLHEKLNLSIGTIHRLLHTLIERGYAAQDKDTRRYGPGPKLLEVAARAASNSRFNLRRVAYPFLEQLTAVTGETANLVTLHGTEVVYIDQVMSAHLVRMFTHVGRRSPLYCTGAGKAILSTFTEQQLDHYLQTVRLERVTPRTIVTPDHLREELIRTRDRGFAIDDEEREQGVRCAAAPIFDHLGLCTAAISISGPTTRLSRKRALELGEKVRAGAAECSAQLGYRPLPAEGQPSALRPVSLIPA
jgi:IclR family transcriptional regulator, acetate operon repressor